MPNAGEGPLRILHAPRNVAGQASDVVAALRRLGHEASLCSDLEALRAEGVDFEVLLLEQVRHAQVSSPRLK